MSYFAGLDLGQAQDYSAVIVTEQIAGTPANYHIRMIERFALGTPYPDVAAGVQKIVRSSELKGKTTLICDATGVGRPVVDDLRVRGLSPISVLIHGGDLVTRDGGSLRVPKRDLAGIIQVLLQADRLKIADTLPLAPTLIDELLNFRVKIDPLTAHDSYSAGREGPNDDLVLAAALSCWYPERSGRVRVWV